MFDDTSMIYAICALVFGVIFLIVGAAMIFAPRSKEQQADPEAQQKTQLAKKNGLLIMIAAALMIAVGLVLIFVF